MASQKFEFRVNPETDPELYEELMRQPDRERSVWIRNVLRRQLQVPDRSVAIDPKVPTAVPVERASAAAMVPDHPKPPIETVGEDLGAKLAKLMDEF